MSNAQRTTLGRQIRTYLGALAAHFDIDAIATTLVAEHGSVPVGDIPAGDFWRIVERHDHDLEPEAHAPAVLVGINPYELTHNATLDALLPLLPARHRLRIDTDVHPGTVQLSAIHPDGNRYDRPIALSATAHRLPLHVASGLSEAGHLAFLPAAADWVQFVTSPITTGPPPTRPRKEKRP